jgi:hypothetical protein
MLNYWFLNHLTTLSNMYDLSSYRSFTKSNLRCGASSRRSVHGRRSGLQTFLGACEERRGIGAGSIGELRGLYHVWWTVDPGHISIVGGTSTYRIVQIPGT